MKNRNMVLIAVVMLINSCLSLQSFAGDSPMEKMFEDVMTSTSAAGAYSTGHREGFSFGGATYRIRHVNTNIFSFRPPSFKGGCAGADFFAGTFSVINKDELIQMGRAVMQGVPSYAFNLALGSICPQCVQEMKALQNKLQAFNKKWGDTCKISKDIVDKWGSGWQDKIKEKTNFLAGPIEAANGVITDYGSILTDPEDSEVSESSSAEIKKHTDTNIIAKAMGSAGNLDWLDIFTTDKVEQQGFLLAITGTTIAQTVDSGTDAPNADLKAFPPLISANQLIEKSDGYTFKIYRCPGTLGSAEYKACLTMVPDPKPTWTGLTGLFLERLLGDREGTDIEHNSLIYKIQNKVQMTPSENEFMGSLLVNYKQMLERTSKNKGVTLSIAHVIAKQLAYQYGIRFIAEIRQFIYSLQDNMETEELYKNELKKHVEKNLIRLDREMNTLRNSMTIDTEQVLSSLAIMNEIKKVVKAGNVALTEGR